jgi:hypothetical protein
MVRNFNTYSRDVSDENIDATSRADILAASRSAMKTLLLKATVVQDVLQIQNEINRLTVLEVSVL